MLEPETKMGCLSNKKIGKIGEILKAYLLWFLTGWRTIKVHGEPKTLSGTYIVCLKNRSVMEMNYSNFGHFGRWFKLGIGNQCKQNPVEFWKPLPKSPLLNI